MRNWKPWFFENSSIPVMLSAIAPIDIAAITIGPFVFSRDEMSDVTKNHETIHWQQYMETGIIGFIILYYSFYLYNYIKYRDGRLAYYSIPFEKEAYDNHEDMNYCLTRKRYNWLWRNN
jgi:hypothetical protein|tara:strand:- start:1612 stop:1968 length:357 start_codon:yes stop_codon:yes gene_type:complete